MHLGVVCQFSCSDGFFLKGEKFVQCKSGGFASSQIPTCQGNECEMLIIGHMSFCNTSKLF